MRQDTFEFLPQLKLLISGNHKPSLQSVDEAMRRRLHLIPFTVTIPPEEKILGFADNILKEEWPAILNWIIEGCLEWQRIGLSPPIAVRDATTAYLDAQDSFAAWLEECCDVGPNTIEARTALYASWSVWAKASGEEVGGARSFYETLDNHGFEKTKHVGKRQYKGLKVKLKPASQHWTEKDQ